MVTGKCLSDQMVEKMIVEGSFATNFAAAFRKYGTNFIAVHPVPTSCSEALATLADPSEKMEPNTCYVPNPGSN